MTQLSPEIINTIQHQFTQHLMRVFGYVEHTAMTVFYLVAVIEMTLFGLMWAMKREEAFADFLFKVLKLGVVFAVITLFPEIIQALIDGFTEVALKASPQAAHVMLNPGQLWKYGFDAGVGLLKFSVNYGTANIGLSMLYLSLGFGILLLFALLGAQIVFVMVMFYLVAMVALLLIPFGAFSGASNFFEQALSALFRAGVRVFVVVIVMGMGVSIWTQFPIESMTQTTTLMQPLGLFFSALVFVILAYRLPSVVAETVGEFRSTWLQSKSGETSVSMDVQAPAVQATSSAIIAGTALGSGGGGSNNIMAATSVSPGSAGASPQSINTAVSVNALTQASGGAGPGLKGKTVSDGTSVQGGISRDTLKQLKTTFKQAIQETKASSGS